MQATERWFAPNAAKIAATKINHQRSTFFSPQLNEKAKISFDASCPDAHHRQRRQLIAKKSAEETFEHPKKQELEQVLIVRP